MAPAEDGDSGMESLTTSSKDLTPEKVKDLGDTDDDSDDEDLDETLSERLWGLTEMFPDKVRETTGVVSNAAWTAVKELQKLVKCDGPLVAFDLQKECWAPIALTFLKYKCLLTVFIIGLYKFSCSASWVFFTSSALLFAPVIIEIERSQMEEMQKQQQRQILLGPNAAVSGLAPVPGHR